MKRLAAIYARVSASWQKDEGTIASQLAALQEYAQHHGLSVPAEWIFTDAGYSGAILARPGLERLRDLVAEGQVEVVLVYAPDRLSRQYAYQVLLLEEFSRQGVETLFVKGVDAQTPEERLLVQFQGMIAEYERAQILERTRRGKRYRAKAGGVGGFSTAAYGYRYERQTDQTPAYLVVQESEAPVVRRIFELYTQARWSVRQIAEHLNQEQVPTRSGKGPWQPSTLWGLLRNSAYQGRAYFGKTRSCPRRKTTKVLRQKGGFNPRRHTSSQAVEPSQWIEVAVPAIISPEVFALAQERLAQGRQLSRRNTKTPSLLQGLLVCAHCGYALCRSSTGSGSQHRHYYRCVGKDVYRQRAQTVCLLPGLRVEYLDTLVWEQILQLLRTPQLIEAELERRRQESLQSPPGERRQQQVQGEVHRLRQQMDKLLDAYQEGLLSLEQLRQRLPDLRKRLTAQEQQLHSLAGRAVEDQRWQQLNQSMSAFLARLNQNAPTLSLEERQKIVRLLVKQIDVGRDSLTIHHAIPLEKASLSKENEMSHLCTPHPSAPIRTCFFTSRLHSLPHGPLLAEEAAVNWSQLELTALKKFLPRARHLWPPGHSLNHLTYSTHLTPPPATPIYSYLQLSTLQTPTCNLRPATTCNYLGSPGIAQPRPEPIRGAGRKPRSPQSPSDQNGVNRTNPDQIGLFFSPRLVGGWRRATSKP